MRSLLFEGTTWLKCEELRQKDKRVHKSLVRILKEMMRGDPTTGIGKPEPLKYNLSGYWSRRLSRSQRIVYRFDDERIYIIAVGGHYEQF